MGKATKAEAMNRLREVTKLLLAGAEFAEIRQFAAERQWGITDRSIRRYMEAAYKRMADASKRDSKQLLGRHLMQRRALYARCLKQGDHRTALNVLKDEAALQGIYPPTKIAPTTPDGQHPYPGLRQPAFSWRERLVRTVIAESKGDKTELRLLEQAAQYRFYRVTDTQLPELMLGTLALSYVSEQLEEAAVYLLSRWKDAAAPEDDLRQELMSSYSSYRFRVGSEGWRLFCEEIGVDADYLIASNYRGTMLKTCSRFICKWSPTLEQLKELMELAGSTLAAPPTPDEL
jgi:hypothetical protein